MKKSLLLLFVCLFGALSGVKAWTSQTPTAGTTYYLYNPGLDQFLFADKDQMTAGDDKRHYGVTPSIFNATAVTLESGWKLSFYIDGVKYYFENNGSGGTADLQTSSANYTIEANGSNYRIHRTCEKSRERYLNATESGGTCDYARQNLAYPDWQFISVSEMESARSAMAVSCASSAANYATTSNGWERVTSVSDLHTNPENYFFAFFSANAPGLMLQASSNNAESQKLYYKTAVNPASGAQYLFEVENHESGGFALKSCAIGKYFSNADYAWDFHANQASATSDNYTNLTLTLANGAYTIQTANSTVNYVGLWTLITNWYSTDKYLAGNKQSSLAGSFLIYRIPKQRLRNVDFTQCITNNSFETGDYTGWTLPKGESGDTGVRDNSGDYATTGTDGSKLFNSWWNGKPLTQDITSLPDGMYELKALIASSDADKDAKIFLLGGDGHSDVITITKGTKSQFNDYSYKFKVTNGSTTIGIIGGNDDGTYNENGHWWYKADNFRLTYLDGLQDLTPVSGLMNAAVDEAQQNAVSAYNSNKTVANYITAQDAIAAAEVSKAAYAQIKSSDLTAYRTKIGNVLTKTNVYTTEAYNKWYANVQDNYDNGVYTNEEVVTLTENGAYNSEWHSSNQIDDILMSTWDEVPMNWDSYHINTWSGEGSEDGSGFLVPFFEYWVAGENVLGAKTMTSTVTGLDANTEYSVNIWARVRQTDNQSKVAGSITMQVGSGLTVDLTTGSQVGSTQFYLNHFTATGSTNGEGQLTITINVAANSNISWLSFKDVAISKQAASGDVQTYSGLINENVVVTPTAEYPIVNISGASFTGTLTANFTSDQNGFIIATAEQKAALGGVKNVVVGYTCENFVLTDGVKAIIPAALTQATNATYSRTIASTSNFGTICVPFALASNDDIQYYTVKSISDGVLTLVETSTVDAGVPAVYKKKGAHAEATNIVITSTDAAIEDNASTQGETVQLIGTFTGLTVGDKDSSAGTAANGNYYIGTDNRFYQGANYITVNPFRAYITGSGENAARLTIQIEDENGTTSIVALEEFENENNLKDGKYLIDGKIVIVKNGVMYSANGQKLN